MADQTTPSRAPRRRLVLTGAAAALGVAALAIGTTAPAHAVAPVKSGWWTDLNQGSPGGAALDGSPALGVPSGGLYVANAGSHQSAIAAVSFAVADGSSVGDLTLAITGSPNIQSPPVACAVGANSLGYQSAQGGPMSSAPAVDCTTTVTGKVNGSTVTFPAAKFLAAGQVAVIVEAGGPTDSITFSKPDDKALQVTAPAAPAAAAPATTPDASPAPTASSPTPAASSAPTAAPSGAAPAASAALATPAAPAAASSSSAGSSSAGFDASLPSTGAASASTPAVAPLPSSGTAPAPPAAADPAAPAAPPTTGIAAKPAASHGATQGRKHAGEVFGIGAVLVALVAWTEGFGILGGRVRQIGSTRRNEGAVEGIAAQ